MTQTHSRIKEAALLVAAFVLGVGLMVTSPGSASAQESEDSSALVVSLKGDVGASEFVVSLDDSAGTPLASAQPVEFPTTAGFHQVTVAGSGGIDIDADCEPDSVTIDLSSMSVEGEEMSTSRSVVVDAVAGEITDCTFEVSS